MGPASEAAGCLFSEFHRLGVLEAQFYENDTAWDKRPKLTPDPALRARFLNAIGRAETLAHARLARDAKDRDALFAMTLASGLQADYAALIEKRNLASLHFTKQASASAQQLLAVCHNCYDALVATGFSKYIIGSMSAPVRWILRMGGLAADKQGGIADLFERCFSVDSVKAYKPSRQAYAHVEVELSVPPTQLCLIACHTWDTLGAVAAGWEAALVRRPGNDVLGVGPQPQIVGDDLNDVVDQLIARHQGSS